MLLPDPASMRALQLWRSLSTAHLCLCSSPAIPRGTLPWPAIPSRTLPWPARPGTGSTAQGGRESRAYMNAAACAHENGGEEKGGQGGAWCMAELERATACAPLHVVCALHAHTACAHCMRHCMRTLACGVCTTRRQAEATVTCRVCSGLCCGSRHKMTRIHPYHHLSGLRLMLRLPPTPNLCSSIPTHNLKNDI